MGTDESQPNQLKSHIERIWRALAITNTKYTDANQITEEDPSAFISQRLWWDTADLVTKQLREAFKQYLEMILIVSPEARVAPASNLDQIDSLNRIDSNIRNIDNVLQKRSTVFGVKTFEALIDLWVQIRLQMGSSATKKR